jgi:hypothetical protein
MFSMLESSAPEPEDEFPDDLTPRPLEDLLDDRDMPPPPMIQITPLSLNSIWDSDMVMKYTDDVTGRKKWRCGHCGQEWFEHNATKALGHVVGIVKDIKSCKGVIAPRYKEAYINLYRTKYDTKAFQRQTIAKLNASLDTTDLRTISTLSERGKKRGVSLEVLDVTDSSPITNSVTTASLSSASNKKRKGTLQTLLSSQFHSSVGVRSHPDAVRAANVAFAHFISANSLAFRLGECILLRRFVRAVQQCGPEYKPPDRMEVGGKLLDATFESYYREEVSKLFEDPDMYSISVYGDGATIKTTPLINVLACSPGNPACVLDVIDCSAHMSKGGRKDARFIATEMLQVLRTLENIKKHSVTQIMFDGASNVQKAGAIISQHYPCAVVEHGAEHVVSLIVEKLMVMPCLREYGKLCKVVSFS